PTPRGGGGGAGRGGGPPGRGPGGGGGGGGSHTRKLEALERRGRALRAEIGRKVEELAHEESRALRELASEQTEVGRLREGLLQGEKGVAQAKQAADQATGATAQMRVIFERAGAAAASVAARHGQTYNSPVKNESRGPG